MRNFMANLICASTILLAAIFYLYVTQEDSMSTTTIVLESQLLIASTQTIWQLNVTNKSLDYRYERTKTKNFWIGGLDCSYELDGIYFSDMANSKLYALDNKSNKSRLVFSGFEHWFPVCLAIEDVTGKLYAGDLIQGGLTVHDLKTGVSSTILGAGLLLCVAIAVDADEKYIFVVDKYQILRMDLDGKNALTIYEQSENVNLEFSSRRFRNGPRKNRLYIGVDGMTLDRKNKRIYWASTRNKAIESSDYNGRSRKIHFRDVGASGEGRSSSNSLAFLNATVYWADPIERRIIKIKSSDKYEVVYTGLDHATMANCERRATTPRNPCAVDNGGCQQLCLLSKSNDDGFSCACKFGYELEEDAKTCRSIQDFLLFLEGGAMKGLSLREKPAYVFQPPGFTAKEHSSIDFDAKSGLLYYIETVKDGEQKSEAKLHERLMDGNGKPKILTPDLFGRQVTNFAYDWTTKNLYYLSQYYSDSMTLAVTNTQDPTYAKVLVKNLLDGTSAMRFFGPVVHPIKGYLFVVTIGGDSVRGEIKRMNTDGSGFKMIYKVGMQNGIGGLSLDYEENRIYWGEVKESGSIFWQSCIKSSNLNGRDIRQFDLTQNIEMPIGITVHQNYIYGIDVGKRLFRVDKDGKNVRVLFESGHFGYSVKIFSRDLQAITADHPCQTHKCHKFCFAVPSETNNLKSVCGCPYGQKLADDDVSCVDNSKKEPPLKSCDNVVTCKMTDAKS